MATRVTILIKELPVGSRFCKFERRYLCTNALSASAVVCYILKITSKYPEAVLWYWQLRDHLFNKKMKQLVHDIHPKPNIEEPRWDQSTYWNRARHFFITTNPLNLFCTDKQLRESKRIVENYRKGEFNDQLTLDELWRAKQIYDSTFHPDTKEKMFIVGRMSAQVPANMVITGMMMTFYKSTPAVVFWQWFNQSFNALVNYTNRSGDSPIPVSQLAWSYVGATGGALITALGLNSLVKTAHPLVGRFVPLCAVAAANCINIPLMRFRELQYGVSLFDSNGTKVGQSTVAAQRAIAMVTLSRILMAVPGMSTMVLELVKQVP
ncbi:hypothetical protein M514_08164 [Trichuris suis]|uniref:Sidoreflexin n=1 Tax=Trichuris suis TaxID=68888 RepID=A0A085NR12_9BILA|nr:hypothetical protein M513_08164 [Trichuris suis]KFD71908.1 hypothetical protein M514_08164 [Trichuris suis]